MKPVTPLNPNDFVVVPHVAAVDEFVMTNDDGSFKATIDDKFIDRLCRRMNEREERTGDLAPLVIGHTIDGQPETESPPLVGYARNWVMGDLFETGRKAAFFDAWVLKDEVERVRKYPRRSCEVWTSRFECDPISLLGATTPARDLGLMKLQNNGSISYTSPGEMNMPEPKDGKPAADPKESGSAKKEEGQMGEMLALLREIAAKLDGGAGQGAPGGAVTPAAGAGAQGGNDQMSDAELEQLLGSLNGDVPDEDKSRKGDKPVQNSADGGYGGPGGDNTHVRLSRVEQENEALRVQLSRRDVKDALKAVADAGRDVNPDDEALIADLIAMPPDMRVRQIETIKKLARPKLGNNSPLLDRALNDPTTSRPGGAKRLTDVNERNRLIKLSREKGVTFESVLRESGYELS